MKKILALALALVLTAAVAIGGTTAWLQDSEGAVNVMTVGKVKIQQHEYQRAEGVAHNEGEAGAGNGIKKGDLVPFEQDQPLFPAVPSGELPYTAEPEDLFYWGEYVYSGTAGNGLWNDNKLQNVLDKMVFVENTGRSPAYFRTIMAFECPEGMEYSEGSDKQFMMNTNGSSLYSWENIGYSNFNGTRYLIMVATYSNALAPGNTAHPSLLQVVMTHHVTNADCEKLGETYEILVMSQAVQTEGFADAESALNAAFGEITATNHPFSNATLISGNDGEALLAALANGEDVIVSTDIVQLSESFNGNGATVTLAGYGPGRYGYLAFIPEVGDDITVENLNVTGSGFVEVGHYEMGGGNYTVNNLVIEDLESTLANGDKGFTLGCAFMAFGDAELNNCVITGTTAKDGVMAVDLACGQAWNKYTDDDDNKISTTVNGGEFGTVYCWSHALATFNGATIDTLYAAPIRGTVTIKAGTHVGTLNINYGTSSAYATDANISKIVIEDGAVVDAIVYQGKTYTQAEWLAR